MRALVIGRGVQGRRWIDNLEKLGYSVKVCGRDYKFKIGRNETYDLIVIAVPHKAFIEVSRFLYARYIFSKRLIIEKPGASNIKEFKEIIRLLSYISNPEMFLPLYIEYGYRNPSKVTYLVNLKEDEISSYNEDYIFLKSGRIIDRNVLRDLFFHPASLYESLDGFLLEYKTGSFPYEIYYFTDDFRKIVVGRSRENIRMIDDIQIEFHNPMEKQIRNRYEELSLDKLPRRIWQKLDETLRSLDAYKVF